VEIELCSSYDEVIGGDFVDQKSLSDCPLDELRDNAFSSLAKGYQLMDGSKIQKEVKAMNANANAELKGKIEWGGEDGIVYTFTGSASVSVSNDNGDHVDITVSQDSDGQGNVEVSGGLGTDSGNKQQ
jgi:hypothetical protein